MHHMLQHLLPRQKHYTQGYFCNSHHGLNTVVYTIQNNSNRSYKLGELRLDAVQLNTAQASLPQFFELPAVSHAVDVLTQI